MAKNRKIRFIIAGVLLLLIVGFVVFYFRNYIFHYQEIKQIEKTNEVFSALLTSEEYQNAETDKRREQVESMLMQLETDGELKADSVGYSEESLAFWFQYPDGINGVIEIGESSAGIPLLESLQSSSYNVRYYVPRRNEIEISVADNKVNYETDIYPYEEENIWARVMLGLDSYQEFILNEKTLWQSENLNTHTDFDCTIENFKTDLDNDEYLCILHHGSFINDTPMIAVEGTYNATASLVKYYDDFHSGRIYACFSSDYWLTNTISYRLTPRFISYYYSGNDLENTIVWLSCCNGYRNDKMVRAFAECGAKAVIGANETINACYNYVMQDAFVYRLLHGDTVGQALAFAKSVHGSNDSEWFERNEEILMQALENKPTLYSAQLQIYTGTDETLVTLVDELATEETAESSVNTGSLRLSESYISLAPGESKQMEIVSLPDQITASDLVWLVEDTTVATVDANGCVTGIKDGITTLIAKSSDETHVFKCTVNVFAR